MLNGVTEQNCRLCLLKHFNQVNRNLSNYFISLLLSTNWKISEFVHCSRTVAHPNMLTSGFRKLKTNVCHCVCILTNKAVFAHTVKTHTGRDILNEWCWTLTAPFLLAKWGVITAYIALILSCSAAALRLEIMCFELRVKVSISCVSVCAFRMFLAFIGWSSIEYTVVGRQWGGADTLKTTQHSKDTIHVLQLNQVSFSGVPCAYSGLQT